MSEYKSFMSEGYSIGAHAESLYGRGYKHYGTMGQGNKQVHIFTPSKGKVDHHMLLKHDGADPARHEGQPDLKKIKGMTEMVETTDVIGIQKAKETKAQRQDRNVNEEDDETISEGWLFGSRYKKIGNKSGSTHRVTFKHLPTNSKHTVDVTAPSDRHAEAHVHRHVLGGRNGNAPIKITRMQHLHEEGSEVMMNETTDPRDNLPIRYAVNHPDSQARHHAREYKKSITAYNAGHAKLASQHRAPTRDQEDELMNHYETASHHHGKYKNRLQQINTKSPFFKKEDLDLQEISKGLATRYLEKAKPAYDAKRKELNTPDHTGPVWGDMKGRIKKFSDQVDKLGRRRKGINRAQDRLKEDLVAEGLASKIMNAAKNLNKSTQFPKDRIDGAETRILKKYPKNTESKAKALKKVEMHRVRDAARRSSPDSEMGGNTHLDRLAGRHMGIHAKLYGKESAARQLNKAMTRKEDLDEGLVSRTLNAFKNANKRLTPSSERIAKTREKVGYDNAKGPDLRPRGKALRSVERIEWSKANPVTRPKPIVPMGKLPDKLWSKDSDKPKPKRVTDDSLDRPMFRKAGSSARRFKSEELEIRSGQKVLKEKPKRGPDGKLIKSKAAQRVEDCIKMSGKKQKIDTEPSYNPLTTAGGGGTPNA